MNNKRNVFFSSVVFLAAALLGAGCGGSSESVQEGARGSIQAGIYKAELRDLPVYTTAVGTLEPYNRAEVSTRIMGNVQQVLVDEGDRVRRGQTLVRLEMQAVSGQIEQSEAMLAAAKAQLENAEAYYNRIKNLYEDKSATRQALDNARSQYEGALAQVRAAGGGIAAARSNLDYSVLTAPFDGYVTGRSVDRGDMAAPGMPIVVIERQDSLKIVATLNEQQFGRVSAGDSAWVETDMAGPGRRLARVESVTPAADPRTRSFRVKLVLDNSDGALKSGLFARVHFATGAGQLIAVPQEAVVRRGQLTGLYTLDSSGLTRLRWVRLGKTSGEMVEILSGLSAGESVVLAGQQPVTEGLSVQEVSR